MRRFNGESTALLGRTAWYREGEVGVLIPESLKSDGRDRVVVRWTLIVQGADYSYPPGEDQLTVVREDTLTAVPPAEIEAHDRLEKLSRTGLPGDDDENRFLYAFRAAPRIVKHRWKKAYDRIRLGRLSDLHDYEDQSYHDWQM